MTVADPHLDDLAVPLRPRGASNLLLWAILAFFLAFLGWAGLTRIDRTVHAPGRVIPSARLQVVAHHEGGIVDDILVRAGQAVKRGQVLVRLSPIAPNAELTGAEQGVAALRARIARLDAEVAGRTPVFPDGPAEAGPVAIERAVHAARMSDLASQTSAAAARHTQAERAVAEAEAGYRSRTAARDSARRQLAMVRPLVDHGVEPQVTLVQLENAAATGDADAAQAAAAVARAQASVAEARAAQAQLRENWRVQAATELAAARAELATRSSATPALADRLRRAAIVSPVDGRVNRVLVTTRGGSIGAGQPIVEIVPRNDTLTVEALVAPKDIAAIHLNQRARIAISAYDSAIHGSMNGAVETISPDATLDERTGESHYVVRIRTDTASLRGPDGRPLPIGPGMTADVSLLGEKRSILSYLLTPITRLSERALRE